ncbi:histidine kinase [Actinomadura sp. ATCC 31491]|uniref:histidine kinase n=1 Tax=Actinomadura luzonensis TaxID=2805427 RepID=A0ABT0G0Q3_9ACTN|nr:histidine kinase [Actinomadura luzonensis]MCK2218171.1 histidine kinase [Actinomadura luzonensis]
MSSTATARSRALLDLALAAAVFAVSLVLLAHDGPMAVRVSTRGLDLTGVALAAGTAVPLAAWRRFPLAVFAVAAGGSVVLAGMGYPTGLLPAPVAALYLLAAGAAWTVRSAAVAAGLLLAYLAASAGGAFPVVGLVHTALPWAAAWFAGERTRLRRQQVSELRRRAVDAERAAEAERLRTVREAERERRLAVAEERARIARDLHDSAGHAISLIAVRAGAARLRQDGDARTLQAIEELARQTAAEIDHLVGSLREDDAEPPAPLGLASLDTLIAHHRAAGLQVELDVAGAARPLGATADQAAYRILQQALANAARHGTGDARVELDFTGAGFALTVTNPVRGTPRRVHGHGLVGMRERASLAGGSLDVTRPQGAYRLHARLPYGGSAP